MTPAMAGVLRRISGRRLTRRQVLFLGGGTFMGILGNTTTQAGTGAAEPLPEGISLDLPPVIQDGTDVPLRIRVESPMTDQDHVRTLRVMAPRNPFPQVALFRFTPLAGRAEVATRIRLDESQTVAAVARLASNEVRIAEREIRVAATGCFAPADQSRKTEDEMRTKSRLPEFERGRPGEVVTVIKHRMLNGLQTDAAGEPIQKRIIEHFEARLGNDLAFSARFGQSIAADPYLRFHLAPPQPGTLTLEWREDTGRTVVDTAQIVIR